MYVNRFAWKLELQHDLKRPIGCWDFGLRLEAIRTLAVRKCRLIEFQLTEYLRRDFRTSAQEVFCVLDLLLERTMLKYGSLGDQRCGYVNVM